MTSTLHLTMSALAIATLTFGNFRHGATALSTSKAGVVLHRMSSPYKTFRDTSATQRHPQQGTSVEAQSSQVAPPEASSPKAKDTTPRTVYDEHDGYQFDAGLVATSRVAHCNAATVNQREPPSQNIPQSFEADANELLRRTFRPEKFSSSELGNIETRLIPQPGLQDYEITLNKTRTLRWSHKLGIAPEFAPIFACYMAASGHDEGTEFQGAETKTWLSEFWDLLQKCKVTAKSLKVARPSRSISPPKPSLLPPVRETADAMVTLYFRSFESVHRILHEPTFGAEYRRYWQGPDSVTIESRLKILLVVGIGSSLYDHGEMAPEFRTTVRQWIYAAQTWLAGPLEKDRLDIGGIQVHCLTILARQIYAVGGDLVWMSAGSLIHSAMQIALHRDPKHLPAMPLLQAEVRRRLWCTILEMATQTALDSGHPPRITFDEFDADPPSNYNDDDLFTTTREPHAKGTYTETSMQLLLLDSLPVRLRIVRQLNGLRSTLAYQDVLALDAEIGEAFQAFNASTKANQNHGPSAFQRNLFEYYVRCFIPPLHCPFVGKARTDPLFHYSLKASLDAAMAIITPVPDEAFSRLMAVGGGMFREGLRCAISVISRELLAQVEQQRLDGTLGRYTQQREILKRALRDMTALAAERVRQGETNIKKHMFLSMVLAQVEAAEEDVPYEVILAKSARDSAEFCYSLLQSRLVDNLDGGLEATTFGLVGFDGWLEGYGFEMNLDALLPETSVG